MPEWHFGARPTTRPVRYSSLQVHKKIAFLCVFFCSYNQLVLGPLFYLQPVLNILIDYSLLSLASPPPPPPPPVYPLPSIFFLVLAAANAGPRVGPQNTSPAPS